MIWRSGCQAAKAQMHRAPAPKVPAAAFVAFRAGGRLVIVASAMSSANVYSDVPLALSKQRAQSCMHIWRRVFAKACIAGPAAGARLCHSRVDLHVLLISSIRFLLRHKSIKSDRRRGCGGRGVGRQEQRQVRTSSAPHRSVQASARHTVTQNRLLPEVDHIAAPVLTTAPKRIARPTPQLNAEAAPDPARCASRRATSARGRSTLGTGSCLCATTAKSFGSAGQSATRTSR